MKATRVEISHEKQSKQWLIRIQVGEEVIRRHSDEPADADEATLRRVAAQAAADEGYTVDATEIVLA
jgi:hypothetical protein